MLQLDRPPGPRLLRRVGRTPSGTLFVATSSAPSSPTALRQLAARDEEADLARALSASLQLSEPPSFPPTYSRDFDQKLHYFRSQPQMRVSSEQGKCDINVRRTKLFEDSFTEIMRKSPAELKKRLNVKFVGEDGLDYGGLSREFFLLLSKEMFGPAYGLFEYKSSTIYTVQINPLSEMLNPEHLEYYMFIGRVMGLAIFHNRLLDVHFVATYYKMMLGKEITIDDLEGEDEQLYRSMTWILENDITDVIEETFSRTEEQFGENVVVELKPGGEKIPVTEANKAEYVQCVTEHRIQGRVEKQLTALLSGLNEVVPLDVIDVFDERELELLIGGVTEIDLDDWKKHTDYRGYARSDLIVQWFWRCVESWPAERRARLLQFATGTSCVPPDGFGGLQGSDGPRRFAIERTGRIDGLPKSHTCFNRIDLPPYESYDVLDQKLTMAVEETSGFGQE